MGKLLCLFENDFSQAPIYQNDNFVGLLTANTITRWLGANVSQDIFSLQETLISEVLNHTEDPGHVQFLPRQANIFEVVEMFQKIEAEGKHLDAILITHSGKEDQTPLGMVTIWDLPKAYEAISLAAN